MSGRAIRAHPTFKSGSYLILIPYYANSAFILDFILSDSGRRYIQSSPSQALRLKLKKKSDCKLFDI